MPVVCDVKDVPIGGVYRDYNPVVHQPQGPEVKVLSKGMRNGIGYNVIFESRGTQILDWHFKYRNPVLWLNDTSPAAVALVTDLVLQTLVAKGNKTDEGVLIEAITVPWLEIVALLEKDPSAAFKIPARQWEEIIAGAYKKAGFERVTLTPRSGDLGRDVIAEKRGLGTVRVIDQVKAYKPGHLVTADDVRALLGVVQADQSSKGFLTTTSDFAPKLREDILLKKWMPTTLELINGAQLIRRLSELAKNERS